jgi:predicted dehydrogenase
MPAPIQIAVLGAGRWGRHFVRHFSQHPHAQLVAVADPNAAALAAVAAQTPQTDAIAWDTSSQALLDRADTFQAIVIATPAITHFALVQTALERGLHVLVEKPLTFSPADCLTLDRQAQAMGRCLFVDHTYGFHPAVTQGAIAVQSGILGDLRYGYGARTHLGPVRQDVDALWDLAIHDLTIFSLWLGENPCAVTAQGRTWLQPGDRPHQPTDPSDRPHPPTGLADWVNLTWDYPSGRCTTLQVGWSNPDKQRRLALVGSAGTLIFDELRSAAPLVVRGGHLVSSETGWHPDDHGEQILEVSAGEPLRLVCDQFLAAIAGAPVPQVAQARQAAAWVAVLAATSQSLHARGQRVDIPSPFA